MFDINNFLEELQEIYNTADRDNAIDFILSKLNDNSLNYEQRNILKFYLGREYFFQNDFDNAEKLFNEILSVKEYEFGTKVYLSEILYNKNKILDSVFLLNEIYQSNPERKYLLEVISNRISELKNFKQLNNSLIIYLLFQ